MTTNKVAYITKDLKARNEKQVVEQILQYLKDSEPSGEIWDNLDDFKEFKVWITVEEVKNATSKGEEKV